MAAGQHGGYDSTVSPGLGVVDGLGLDLRTLARELAGWSAPDDSQPQPEVREAASTALRAADRMLSDLNGLRGRLVTEIRYSDRGSSPHGCAAGGRGGGRVKIRLHGTEDECREVAERLRAIVGVLAVSQSYPDRGTSCLVRVYVEIRLDPPPGKDDL